MATKRTLRIDHDLGDVASLVFDKYIGFLTAPERPEEAGDSKAFANWNNAAISLFAHFEKLEKFAETHGSAAQHRTINGLLVEAREALSAPTPEEKEDQDGDAGGAA